jgi:transcription elongation factor Elf1
MVCPKCKSENVSIQTVAETQKRGCLTVLLYIILLCIPVIGWIALFMLLRGKKSKTVSYAVCQSCGHKWKA